MNSMQLSMAVPTPSRFGVPASDQGSFDLSLRGTYGWRAAGNDSAVPSARYRVAGTGGMTTKGHLGLIPTCVVGTPAWRPPIS